MDEILHHLRNPGSDASLVNSNKWSSVVSQIGEGDDMDFVHPQQVSTKESPRNLPTSAKAETESPSFRPAMAKQKRLLRKPRANSSPRLANPSPDKKPQRDPRLALPQSTHKTNISSNKTRLQLGET